MQHALQIFTDASKEGWGAHLNEFIAIGTWSLPESALPTTRRDMTCTVLKAT